MIKKAALILFTFSALVGAHLLYTAGFAMLADHLAATGVESTSFTGSEPDSAVASRQLALAHFGPDHFSTKQIKLSYYDKSKGSYLYAEEHQFSDNGKVMDIWPFAMISVSKDGKSHKTVTSDRAIIRFNQPFAFLRKSSEPQRIIHAELVGHVMIRDDKGTTAIPNDDLLIGPLTSVQYEEKTLQITSSSEVLIHDQDMTITGRGLLLQLRRKLAQVVGTGTGTSAAGGGGGAGSFDAEAATINSNVHIEIANVTSGGILPGQSKPDGQGKTPLRLDCAGLMHIDLPKSPPPVVIGPPNIYRLPEPTICRFEKNVRVIRGVTNPDQLNCDTLFLTLRPDAKPDLVVQPAANGEATPPANPGLATSEPQPATGGPLTQLKLRTALAQGHAVWLQSESQNLKAKGVELKYDKKLDQGQPDSTYLNGGTNKQLWVEKEDRYTEGPKAGTVKSVMTLVAADLSILDFGNGGENQITARGPGRSEERPSRSQSVTRVALFEDKMLLQTSREGSRSTVDGQPNATIPKGPLRRLVTLFGQAQLEDKTTSSTLDAREKIVAEFESTPPPTGSPAGDGPSRIKWLQAYNNVHLMTPGRTLTAWRDFQAIFVEPEPAPAGLLAANSGPAVSGTAPSVAQADGESALPEVKPDAPPPPQEGAVDGRALHVYATIVQGKGPNQKGDLRDAKLRGDVMVHQDPAPGERQGKNAVGQALDLFSQGKGMMKFVVGAADPQAANPATKTRLVAGRDPKADLVRSRRLGTATGLPPAVMARVEFDGKIIESENIIGLDQQANFASASGKGKFIQMADAGLFDDKGLASDKARAKATQPTGARERLEISWTDEMKFFGRSTDRQNREVAKIEFRGTTDPVPLEGRQTVQRGVQAVKVDAGIYCDSMDVYMDKTIDFSKANRMPGATTGGDNPTAGPGGKPTEPDAEIAFIECRGVGSPPDSLIEYAGVDVTNQKFFPGTKILEDKYRIQHTHLIYDKRSGDFEGSGAGTAYLYKGKLPDPKVAAVPAKGASANEIPLHTVTLTQIQFTELMKGRFGVTRSGVDRETRTAEFLGDVQTANAVVTDGHYQLDFDKLDKKPDAVFLTSEVLRVRSEPQPSGKTKVPDRQFLYANGNAAARTVNRLIQADRITFDSGTQLFYAYGDEGKLVSLLEQIGPGQPPNRTTMTALRYNKLTGESQPIEPQQIQIFDLKTATRPKAAYPDLGGSPRKPEVKPQQRTKIQRPARNSVERYGFTGH